MKIQVAPRIGPECNVKGRNQKTKGNNEIRKKVKKIEKSASNIPTN
jgi:hypothetical protein